MLLQVLQAVLFAGVVVVGLGWLLWMAIEMYTWHVYDVAMRERARKIDHGPGGL
jgi:hypothetical protein